MVRRVEVLVVGTRFLSLQRDSSLRENSQGLPVSLFFVQPDPTPMDRNSLLPPSRRHGLMVVTSSLERFSRYDTLSYVKKKSRSAHYLT